VDSENIMTAVVMKNKDKPGFSFEFFVGQF